MSTDKKKSERGFTLVDQDKDSEPTSEEGQEAIPPIDFSTFVLSLGASALYQLGRLGDAKSGEEPVPVNLVAESVHCAPAR